MCYICFDVCDPTDPAIFAVWFGNSSRFISAMQDGSEYGRVLEFNLFWSRLGVFNKVDKS